jgi:ATP adenylyltransferase
MERLWAPWRSAYVTGEEKEKRMPGCFFCQARDTEDAAAALTLARGAGAFVIMNRYPYNTGHLMVACNDHRGEIEAIDPEAAGEMWRLLVACKEILAEAMEPQGFNIGINQGRCAGAGVVDHLHMHLVPRWAGDTNFMPVTGQTRVMSQSLDELYRALLPRFAERGMTP